MSPLVSVVIVNHNYERYLGECIDSVLAQTYPNVEIIAVDDGSTDNSLRVLRSYGNRISAISQANKGVSAARNAGIRKSNGEWIAFLDADDVWLPEKLQEQSNYFEDPSVCLIFCGVQYIDEFGGFLKYSPPQLTSDPLREFATFTYPAFAGGSTAVVRADCLRRLRGFDEGLLGPEDVDLWIRIAAEHEVRTIQTPLVKYRRHPGSLSLNVELFEENNSRMLAKLFSNPKCERVHHLRRQGFGRFYMILAGSYFHSGNFGRAMRSALKAILYRPSEVAHLLALPLRAIRRLRAFNYKVPYGG